MLKTATTPTLPNKLCLSSQSGRLSRCLPANSAVCPLYVASAARFASPALFSLLTSPCVPGFIPVVYAWYKARNAPPQLPLDDEDAPKGEHLQGWSIFLLWLPAACDLTGTTVSSLRVFVYARIFDSGVALLQLMNVGLLYTPVSIYQMTRGALVLWVGLFSVMFLRRKLWLYQSVGHRVISALTFHACRL